MRKIEFVVSIALLLIHGLLVAFHSMPVSISHTVLI
jgi:hypothetical protein